MGRTIDENSVIDIVTYECGEWSGLAKEIVKQIKAIPSAERKGHWENAYALTEYMYRCSECFANHRARYDYCPSCGARMESE